MDLFDIAVARKLSGGGGGGGGGGDSDFSTAEVTFVFTSGDSAGSDNFYVVLFDTFLMINDIAPVAYQAILYKGHATVNLYSLGGITSTAGNVTINYNEDDGGEYASQVDITGDCTITLIGYGNN